MKSLLPMTLAGLAVMLAGCGGGGDHPVAAKAPAATPGKTVKGAEHRPDADGNGVPDAITVKGHVGDTLALQGSGLHDDLNDHTKSRIRVTVQRVRGPFKGYDIPAGRKLIGIDLRVANVGGLVYDDPLPDGVLSVAGGETGKQTNLIQLGGQKDPCDNPSLKLRRGQSKSVCIAFNVPARGKLQAFQYVTDSGYGDTGVWSLR